MSTAQQSAVSRAISRAGAAWLVVAGMAGMLSSDMMTCMGCMNRAAAGDRPHGRDAKHYLGACTPTRLPSESMKMPM